MASHASAARYAKALLDVSVQQADVRAVGQSLASFAETVKAHPDLRRALFGPGIAVEARTGLVKTLATRAEMPAPLARLLGLLAERGRLELLPDINELFQARLLAHQQIVPAEVTSAVPLTEAQRTALATRLSGATGATVQLTEKVDPDLLGGVVARIGGTVYDGSLQTQLRKVEQQLAQAAS